MALSGAFGWKTSSDTAGESASSESAAGLGIPQPAALFPSFYVESWYADALPAREAEAGVKPDNKAPASDPIHELGWTVPPTPTPAPTVAPRPTAAVASSSYTSGVEQWRELVASIFPAESVETVLRIMNCESHGNPNATGASGERGLMQIHPLHFDSTYDPEGNLRAALRISSGGYSWGAWSCR